MQQLFSIAKKLFTEVQWHSAFESCGLLDERKLSQRVLRQLGWATPVTVNVDVLTPEQLAIVFPRRAKVSSDAIFRWAAPKAKAKAKPEPKPKAAAKAAAIAPSDGPPCHGTRKRAAKAKAKPTALD